MADKEIVIVYDFETTGPKPEEDAPVQTAAAIMYEDGSYGILMNCLSNPMQPILPGATEVHGITQGDVDSHPDPYQIVAFFKLYIQELEREGYMVIIAGQNHIRFDNPIAERFGFEGISKYPQIDSYKLSRRALPTLMDHKLGTVYKELVGEELSGAHDAMVDVFGVCKIIQCLATKLNKSVYELAKYCEKPLAYTVLPFSKKHKGKPFQQVPVGFLRWMIKNTDILASDPDFVESLRVHHKFLYDAHVPEDLK